MPRILLIKMSSLGDVIHNLPIVSDIHAHYHNASIHWVVEEGFAEIPQLHSGVELTLPVALRRWRRRPREFFNEWTQFKKKLQQTKYDFVLDTQGLLKSAVITKISRGESHGYSLRAAREPLSAMFYDVRHFVNCDQHAVTRNRQLAAMALGYELSESPKFGIHIAPSQQFFPPKTPYVVLLHATSNPIKQWSQDHWVALGQTFHDHGLLSILPSGNESELNRSRAIAQKIPSAVAPPALSLTQLSGLLAGAQIVIGVDTGLTHLAAALNTPVVAIYGASDPALTGVFPAPNRISLGGLNAFPKVDEVMRHVMRLGRLAPTL